jgi:hypothetical protein
MIPRYLCFFTSMLGREPLCYRTGKSREMFVTRKNRFLCWTKLSWAKLLNVLSTCWNGTGKPSTLMRRCEILLLLIMSICLPDSQPRGGTCVRLDVLCGGIPDKPCTQDCKLRSQTEDFWEPLGQCQLCEGITPCV